MDITRRFEAEKEIVADLWPNSLEYPKYQGKLYGGPDSRLSASIFHYNKDMFDQVGLEDPNDMDEAGRWTLDALASAAKRLTRDTNGDQCGTDAIQQQGGAYCILSTTKHPQEAWTFVKWLYSTEASKINCVLGAFLWSSFLVGFLSLDPIMLE